MQRNYVVSLLRKEKKQFYSNLNINVLIDEIILWKTANTFSDYFIYLFIYLFIHLFTLFNVGLQNS